MWMGPERAKSYSDASSPVNPAAAPVVAVPGLCGVKGARSPASFAWQAGVPAQAIIARFPRTLADQLGLDPASLADQLEQLHEQGNALADLLTQ